MSNDNPFGFDKSNSSPFESPSSGSSPTASAAKSGGCGKIVMLVAAIGLVVLVCCGGLTFFGGKKAIAAMKAPIEKSIEVMAIDAEVKQKLGTPIESTSTMGVSQYNNHNGNGDAKVNFTAKGPKGTANVAGNLTLTAGTWSVDQLTIKFSDGSSATIPRGSGIDINPMPIETGAVRRPEPGDFDLTIPPLKPTSPKAGAPKGDGRNDASRKPRQQGDLDIDLSIPPL